MLKIICEKEFLSRTDMPIEYIGIYELDWLVDDNQLDCEGIIVAFKDKRYLITSKETSYDNYEFFYYEFEEEYDCRKIIPSSDEALYFVRYENEEHSFRILRFKIGSRPILVTAFEDNLLIVGISHWGEDGTWLDFDNTNLLNDGRN